MNLANPCCGVDTERDNAINRVMAAFERAWQGPTPPNLSDFLPREGELRPLVFRELVHVDVELRQRKNLPIDWDGYQAAYPDLLDSELLAELQQKPNQHALGLHPPARIGRYCLLGAVGRGAFGTVYRARDEMLNRVVAVKLILAETLGTDAWARVAREARHPALLRHPAIASVHDLGEVDGWLYVVSDFIEGDTFQKALHASNKPGLPAIVGWLADLAEAAHAAHEHGLVHRDIKPANVMLTRPNSAGARILLLVDFGLSRDINSAAALTGTGDALGTPWYAAPELLLGRAHLADRRADIYSIGVMLYEVLTGKVPFTQPHQAHAKEESLTPALLLNPTAPADLASIAEKALARDPADRYRTGLELAEDLRRYLRDEPIQARPPSRLRRLRRWSRRNPLVVLLVVSILTGSMISSLGWRRAVVERRGAEMRLRQSQNFLASLAQLLRSPYLQHPEMEPARQELLDHLAEHIRPMLEDDQLHPRDRAHALTIMGYAHRGHGRPNESIAAFEEAIALWQGLRSEEITDQLGLARALLGILRALALLDRVEEAREKGRLAWDICAGLVERHQCDEARLPLAEAAVYSANQGRPADTVAQRQARWKHARQLLREARQTGSLALHIDILEARSHASEAQFLTNVNLRAEALRSTDAAITGYRSALERMANNPAICWELAAVLSARGQLHHGPPAHTEEILDLLRRAYVGLQQIRNSRSAPDPLVEERILHLGLIRVPQVLEGLTPAERRAEIAILQTSLNHFHAVSYAKRDWLAHATLKVTILECKEAGLSRNKAAMHAAWKRVLERYSQVRLDRLTDPERASVAVDLGTLHSESVHLRDPHLGRDILRLAIRTLEEKDPPSDMLVWRSHIWSFLGREERACGDLEASRQALEKAAPLNRQAFRRKRDWQTLKWLEKTLRQLADAYRLAGQYDRAEELLQETWDLLVHAPGRYKLLAEEYRRLAESLPAQDGRRARFHARASEAERLAARAGATGQLGLEPPPKK